MSTKPATTDDQAKQGEVPPVAPLPTPMPPPTPMMAQFLNIKADHQDYLLFYRMGDFYELFFDDAVKASEALSITLTKRGKHLGQDIPMCGVPVHAADGYLEKLIQSGFKVAVCEQTEDPAEAKKRGAKSVVAREVVRLVTAGTLTEETLLDARAHNYLASFARVGGSAKSAKWALAWIDISTGEFQISATSQEGLAADLARLMPGEVLFADTLLKDDLKGLVLCEAEMVSREAVCALAFPPWATREVTQDAFFNGGNLCNVTPDELAAKLSTIKGHAP